MNHIEDKLYQRIRTILPIPCVDIIVVNIDGKVLLGKRNNEPVKNEWWFPGGRVHYLETRKQAAIRKIWEECSLHVNQPIELATYDVIIKNNEEIITSHAISTLFIANISKEQNIHLDSQHFRVEWRFIHEWIGCSLNTFIIQGLKYYQQFINNHSNLQN